jgi:hypothetical protein
MMMGIISRGLSIPHERFQEPARLAKGTRACASCESGCNGHPRYLLLGQKDLTKTKPIASMKAD